MPSIWVRVAMLIVIGVILIAVAPSTPSPLTLILFILGVAAVVLGLIVAVMQLAGGPRGPM